ncbi:hypothetical protein C7459_101166 [Tumebacillus permanentifrigoris]|uniref:Uncharacterized protein n=1 Tax=Tumebacillus permanentifrigoris TaxID=378543 RepID=A0A316DFH8_9BACL|nr:hypothetical protein C7459_101166 [Tumebacillus permanentifrigoris]
MKKRTSLFVIVSCALLSCMLVSPSLGAWWNEPGPNHKTFPSWPPNWPPGWSTHPHFHLLADAEVVPPEEPVEPPVVPPAIDSTWWNENGPNH